MTVLALVTTDDTLSAAQAAQQIDMLRRAQDYVRVCDVLDELVDAHNRAEMVKKWVRLHNAAQAIELEACKLDWLALRKLAAIDPMAIKSTKLRSGARWLAKMAQAEFDERLRRMEYPMSPWQAERDEAERRWSNGLRAIGRGDDFDPPDYDLREVAAAAAVLLAAAQAEGMASTTALREALKDALPNDRENDLVNEGIDQVIRQAFRSQSLPDGYPAWVTWYSESAGWVHVPFDAATLEQLAWMADYRRKQAADLAASARHIEGLVRILRACSARLGGVQRLATLRQVREQAQEDRDRAAYDRAHPSKPPAPPKPEPPPQCTGTASKGRRPCRNAAVPGTDRCEYHGSTQ